MKKVSSFKISRMVIQFLGKNGIVEETHTTTFRLKPHCQNPENIRGTIQDHIVSAAGEDKRPYLLEIRTSKGKFFACKGKLTGSRV